MRKEIQMGSERDKLIFIKLIRLKAKTTVIALEGVTKRTKHHSYSIGIYLQEQRMVTGI